MSKTVFKTMKAHILDFVESRGIAKRKDIVKFIVDFKFGEGTYDKDPTSYRGYYSTNFSPSWDGYLLKGCRRLVNIGGGKYKVETNYTY